jgi:hypothetical protein
MSKNWKEKVKVKHDSKAQTTLCKIYENIQTNNTVVKQGQRKGKVKKKKIK